MANHETAIGANTKGGYIEHKVTGKATVGYEYMDRDEYQNQDAVYLQYDLIGSEVKAIGGYRWNLPGDKHNWTLVESGCERSWPRIDIAYSDDDEGRGGRLQPGRRQHGCSPRRCG